MSTITENRLVFQRQGSAVSSATALPLTNTVTSYINNVGHADNSNANGIRMPDNYANQTVVGSVTGFGTPDVSGLVAVYGYVRRVREPTDTGIGSAQTFTTLDASSGEAVPWAFIKALNGGQPITRTTNAVGGFSVIETGPTSFRYHEDIPLGGMYERIRFVALLVTGSLYFDLGYAGGQR